MVSVDYSAFRDLYGGDFGGRLLLAKVTDCDLTLATTSCTQAPVPVAGTNDSVNGKLTAVVTAEPDPDAVSLPLPSVVPSVVPSLPPLPSVVPGVPPVGGLTTKSLDAAPIQSAPVHAVKPVVVKPAVTRPLAVAVQNGSGNGYVIVSSVGSAAGNYGASSVAGSQSWSAGGSSGSFGYSYPLSVPPGIAGAAPSLGLSYDSGSIDGRSGATNTQASWAGLGWDLGTAFIERSYQSCSSNSAHPSWGDLCYNGITPAMSISLNGHSSQLINVGGSTYRLKDDPGWLVQDLFSSNDNGVRLNEFFVVRTPDGTAYVFGFGSEDGSGSPTNSVQRVPIVDNPNGCDAAHTLAAPAVGCYEGYRFNLDRVLDPNGNETTYFYQKEINAYNQQGSTTKLASYDRGAWLDHINYGLNIPAAPGLLSARARVLFGVQQRCTQMAQPNPTACPAVSNANASSFPDIPLDQLYGVATTTPSTPSFFTAVRLDTVTTQVLNGGNSYENVAQWKFNFLFPNAGPNSPVMLWLNTIVKTGLRGGSIALPLTSFGGVVKNNRSTGEINNGATPVPMFRLSVISNDTGGQVAVTYGQADACLTNYAGYDTSNNGTDCYPAWATYGSSSGWGWYNKYLVATVTKSDLVAGDPMVTTSYGYVGGPGWHQNMNPITQATLGNVWDD